MCRLTDRQRPSKLNFRFTARRRAEKIDAVAGSDRADDHE